ncbi:MAG: hypothetical protein A2Z59_06190 [Nitrospinae bacterium RIFCSPLOWO2_02_39_17]|nr:MAG: hypothetical protein A3D97_07025 [Nitrospinae bacterium RIFCSPHIGHO2_12_FULL_39_42]OGV99145.1 MAG: hypothetical protein A2W53_04385 [Nitrospinae bacterium RIFCSPHIGHO2_02_39_11]OGW05987.1 MAG: hypothetical protein A2Z59_06190 [Nitrospinae bacterium RIFCSPLOWO2_02_39_17]OGW11785.1 MAG: hypothetical protein A2W75_07435 [Nitrospinae bacterium RIFCSPLOWO2_12_39_15]
METLSEQITKLASDFEKEFEGEINYEELRAAAESYNEMVKLGIIKKRGYSLLSIDQTNIRQPAFNS